MLLGWMEDDGFEHKETQIVAWALLESREDPKTGLEIAPVIPHPFEDDRFFTFDFSGWGIASSLVEPGQNPTKEQWAFVRAYAEDLAAEHKAYGAAVQKARTMRREGASLESIVEVTKLSNADAHQIALRVDREKRSK
jgi:hypothetical protein